MYVGRIRKKSKLKTFSVFERERFAPAPSKVRAVRKKDVKQRKSTRNWRGLTPLEVLSFERLSNRRSKSESSCLRVSGLERRARNVLPSLTGFFCFFLTNFFQPKDRSNLRISDFRCDAPFLDHRTRVERVLRCSRRKNTANAKRRKKWKIYLEKKKKKEFESIALSTR